MGWGSCEDKFNNCLLRSEGIEIVGAIPFLGAKQPLLTADAYQPWTDSRIVILNI